MQLYLNWSLIVKVVLWKCDLIKHNKFFKYSLASISTIAVLLVRSSSQQTLFVQINWKSIYSSSTIVELWITSPTRCTAEKTAGHVSLAASSIPYNIYLTGVFHNSTIALELKMTLFYELGLLYNDTIDLGFFELWLGLLYNYMHTILWPLLVYNYMYVGTVFPELECGTSGKLLFLACENGTANAVDIASRKQVRYCDLTTLVSLWHRFLLKMLEEP